MLPFAGKLRKVNIRKREWILRDESVTYGSAETLKASLARCFIDEREFDYSRLSAKKMIPHFCRFIAQIWQIHPFGEGNTRATAVFAIKYLRSLGFRAGNNMFKDNSWYFRNALARANFADFRYGAKRDWSFLEAFFRNLLLGEDNLLKSRLMLIGMSEREREIVARSLGIGGGKNVRRMATGEKTARKSSLKSSLKSRLKSRLKSKERILSVMAARPDAALPQVAKETGLSLAGVKKNVRQLKEEGRLRRVGPDKGGHWEVVK